MPFGSAEEALKNASTLGYLNAAQALADYAAILLHVKEKYSTKHSPIIVIGGSYGGSKSIFTTIYIHIDTRYTKYRNHNFCGLWCTLEHFTTISIWYFVYLI